MRKACLVARLLATSCLFIGGCTNAPGALELSLVPAKSTFGLGEPVLINATLEATDGPVCLGKTCVFHVELRRADGSELAKTAPVAYCGTGYAVSLPLWPVLVSVAFLDVGDVMDRYTVLPRAHKRTHHFEVFWDGSDELGLNPDAAGMRWMSLDSTEPLPSASYRLRAKLIDTVDYRCVMNSYPAPLFWKVYDRPVVAETEFVIEEGSTVGPEAE